LSEFTPKKKRRNTHTHNPLTATQPPAWNSLHATLMFLRSEAIEEGYSVQGACEFAILCAAVAPRVNPNPNIHYPVTLILCPAKSKAGEVTGEIFSPLFLARSRFLAACYEFIIYYFFILKIAD
jgi:hypothetical protein